MRQFLDKGGHLWQTKGRKNNTKKENMKNLYKYLQTCKFGRLGRKYLKPSENWGQIMWEGKNYPGKKFEK